MYEFFFILFSLARIFSLYFAPPPRPISFLVVLPLCVLRTFLLFFFWRSQKEMEKQKLFVQDTMKARRKTKTSASIIKHAIIQINMYLEKKGMNVVFHHHPNGEFFISSSFCAFLLCIACIPFLLFRKMVSTQVY